MNEFDQAATRTLRETLVLLGAVLLLAILFSFYPSELAGASAPVGTCSSPCAVRPINQAAQASLAAPGGRSCPRTFGHLASCQASLTELYAPSGLHLSPTGCDAPDRPGGAFLCLLSSPRSCGDPLRGRGFLFGGLTCASFTDL